MIYNPYYMYSYNPLAICNTINQLNSQMQQCNYIQQLQEQDNKLMCQISQQEQNRLLTEQINQCCCTSKNVKTHTEYINQNSRWNSGICFKYFGSPCRIWNENQIVKLDSLYDVLFPFDPIKRWGQEQERLIDEKYKYLEWMV